MGRPSSCQGSTNDRDACMTHSDGVYRPRNDMRMESWYDQMIGCREAEK